MVEVPLPCQQLSPRRRIVRPARRSLVAGARRRPGKILPDKSVTSEDIEVGRIGKEYRDEIAQPILLTGNRGDDRFERWARHATDGNAHDLRVPLLQSVVAPTGGWNKRCR